MRAGEHTAWIGLLERTSRARAVETCILLGMIGRNTSRSTLSNGSLCDSNHTLFQEVEQPWHLCNPA